MPAAPATSRRPKATPATRLAAVLARAADDAKANEIVVLKVGEVSDIADYFIVASGTSDAHVRSTADKLVEAAKADGTSVLHVEGTESGKWVVLDFVDVVVHLFVPALREYYQLERLWSDAPRVPVDRLA